MKLSIIVPYYKTLEATKNLMKVLLPQLTNEVEVILVDDGCDEKALDKFDIKVIHLEANSGGASRPRNIALDNAKGEYVAFIDSDDMISPDYVKSILEALNGKNYYYLSWSWKDNEVVRIESEPPNWNTSVWNCVYKRELIGDKRFNENLVMGEDKEFNDRVRKGTKGIIPKVLYHYNFLRDGSITKLHHTYKTVLYYRVINAIGGIEQWFYMIAKKYSDTYDITVMYQSIDSKQLERLEKYVRCVEYKGQKVYCDNFIFCYDGHKIIDNIEAKNYYFFIHGDYRYLPKLSIPKQTTKIFAVSELAKESFIATHKFDIPIETVYNPLVIEKPKQALRLVSATRMSPDKGLNRMRQLANYLRANDISFEWDIFTDSQITAGENITVRPARLDIYSQIIGADFLVQLSDTEAYSYTLVESLALGTPLIVTRLPVLKEMGVNDENAIILDFDMSNIEIVKDRIYEKFEFEYKPNQSPKLYESEILGEKSKSNYVRREQMKKDSRFIVKDNGVAKRFNLTDSDVGRVRELGEQWEVDYERLQVLLGNNSHHKAFVEVVKEIPKRTPKTAVAKKVPAKRSTVVKNATKPK